MNNSLTTQDTSSSSTSNSTAKHIFFCCYGGGHINMLIPIIKKAQAEGFKTTVLGLTTATQSLNTHGIENIGFKDLLRFEENSEHILSLGRALTGGQTHPQISQQESDAYHGLNFRDLQLRFGDEAHAIYKTEGRNAFYPLPTILKLLTQSKPDLVISTNSPRSERVSLIAAKTIGIPAICLVDLFAYSAIPWLKQQGLADFICVFHPKVKQFFIGEGVPESIIQVTGNAAFDKLATPPSTLQQQAMRDTLNLQNKKMILWASQPEPAIHPRTKEVGDPNLPRHVDEQLIKLLDKHPDWQLVIRPHPSEQIQQKHKEHPQVSYSSQADDLACLLYCSDCVITFSSTVGLEASLIGKPLISIMLSNHAKNAAFKKFQLEKEVHNLDTLETQICELLGNNHRDSSTFAEETKFGQAAANIWALAKSIL